MGLKSKGLVFMKDYQYLSTGPTELCFLRHSWASVDAGGTNPGNDESSKRSLFVGSHGFCGN